MHSGRLVFSQLTDFLPLTEFRACVKRYHGHRRVRSFSCYTQFLCLAFGQLTGRQSLRDIVTCLNAVEDKRYHAGFRGPIARSTFADANEQRHWRIFADFAIILIHHARQLYADDPLAVELDRTAYVLDSTLIDLCLSVFPWARYKRHRGAVKLHTQMDLRGSIPSFIHISDGKMHDVKALDLILIEPGAFYIMDRGYIDFARLYRFTRERAYFLIRARRNIVYRVRDQRAVDRSTGLRCDQTIRLYGADSVETYPDLLRRIAFYDVEHKRRFVFLTNDFDLPALALAQLYHCRWQVELFFKWIKQHLRIQVFFGTSPNAVKTQIWTAISVYVLVAILKKELKIERPMNEILQILSISLFEQVPVSHLLTSTLPANQKNALHNPLPLFDL